MNQFKFRGKIKQLGKVQKGTSKAGKDWAKLEVLVEEIKDQYPQSSNFTLFKSGDNIKFVNEFADYAKAGDLVDIDFSLNSRTWNNDKGEEKIFNSLDAWKITKVEQEANPITQPEGDFQDEEDDLPF